MLKLFKIVVALTEAAHLFLDGFHLLVEIVLPLAPLHLFLDAAADAFFNFDQVNFAVQLAQQQVNALANLEGFKKLLLLGNLQLQMGCHGVCKALKLIDAGQRIGDFRGHLPGELHVLLELVHQGFDQYFLFPGWQRVLIHQHGRTGEILAFSDAGNGCTGVALNQDLDGAIRQPEHLQYCGYSTHGKHIIRAWFVRRRISLSHQQDFLVALHGRFQCLYGLLSAHKQRHHHVREHHHISQRQQRVFLHGLFRYQGHRKSSDDV